MWKCYGQLILYIQLLDAYLVIIFHLLTNYQSILSSGTSSTSKTSEMAASESFDDAPTYTEPVGRIVKEAEIKQELQMMGEECLKIISTLSVESTITEESRSKLNSRIEVVITQKCDMIKQRTKDALKIDKSDVPETVVTKVGVVQELDSFLDKLFNWIVEKLAYFITQLIEQGLQWCKQKAFQFFEFLQSFFWNELTS